MIWICHDHNDYFPLRWVRNSSREISKPWSKTFLSLLFKNRNLNSGGYVVDMLQTNEFANPFPYIEFISILGENYVSMLNKQLIKVQRYCIFPNLFRNHSVWFSLYAKTSKPPKANAMIVPIKHRKRIVQLLHIRKIPTDRKYNNYSDLAVISPATCRVELYDSHSLYLQYNYCIWNKHDIQITFALGSSFGIVVIWHYQLTLLIWYLNK